MSSSCKGERESHSLCSANVNYGMCFAIDLTVTRLLVKTKTRIAHAQHEAYIRQSLSRVGCHEECSYKCKGRQQQPKKKSRSPPAEVPEWSDDAPPQQRKESRRSTHSSSDSSAGISTGAPLTSNSRRRSKPGDNSREKRRRKIVLIIVGTAVALLVMSILLVAITLKLTPAIDEKIRKENEEILKNIQSSGAAANSRPENSTGPPRATPSSLTPPPISEG
uniref:Uncharacterized protein n=1 Tax=Strigamia maritima TaxID=126957 RepID=T1JG04_STRMM